jgi:GTPase SAR1 family protein
MDTRTKITNYRQTVMSLTADLQNLRRYCAELGLEASVAGVDGVLARLEGDAFNVAVVGEFKRGKSTLINALLGRSILPADVLPCSATLNRVAYGVEPRATVEYRDGSTEDVGVEELGDYVTKLTPESERRAATVRSATVYYPTAFCRNGVTIIDTPGLNDDEAMTEVTLGVLPEADAAIMVMMCGSPFSESERAFLEQKVMAADLGRVVFVVTGIDRYDEEEQERLLGLFRRRISESVLAKARSVYGEDSDEYRAHSRKLGDVRVYPVSARGALRAKLRGDDAMLRESRFPEFEDGLMDFLVTDRGALQLSAPVARAKNTAAEIIKAIELRVSSMDMSKEEFEAKYAEAMERIATIREERKAELQKISAAADATYQDLLPQIKGFWSSIEKAAYQAIDDFPIASVKDIKSESTQEELGKVVSHAIQNESQLFSERIQHAISEAATDEANRLEGFEESFFSAMAGIQDIFTQQKKNAVDGVTIAAVAGNAFTGVYGGTISGAYEGYKTAGWKGALLGGGVGFASAFGASVAGIVILTAVGLSLPAVAVFAASGLVSTRLSRLALDAAFKDARIAKFREQYKDAVHKQITEMRTEHDFPGAIRDQVNATFDALRQSVVTETETILENTQTQLSDLRVDRAKNQNTLEKENKELSGILEKTTEIMKRSTDLEAELTRVLARQA